MTWELKTVLQVLHNSPLKKQEQARQKVPLKTLNPRGKGKVAKQCQQGYCNRKQLKTYCLGESKNGTKHLAGERFGSS